MGASMNSNKCYKKIFFVHFFILSILTFCLSGCADAPNCGGIAGIQCPDGLVCIDDPGDDCDPQQGGADCFGICVKDSTLDNQFMETLNQNREKWNSFQIKAYSYSYRRTCECLPDKTREVVITVSDGEITEIKYSNSSEEVDENPQGFYKTISELYNLIEDAINENSHQISVTYDDQYGYPADIFIDYDNAVADEEFIVVTGNVIIF
jgi:hypothetical protein